MTEQTKKIEDVIIKDAFTITKDNIVVAKVNAKFDFTKVPKEYHQMLVKIIENVCSSGLIASFNYTIPSDKPKSTEKSIWEKFKDMLGYKNE